MCESRCVCVWVCMCVFVFESFVNVCTHVYMHMLVCSASCIVVCDSVFTHLCRVKLMEGDPVFALFLCF